MPFENRVAYMNPFRWDALDDGEKTAYDRCEECGNYYDASQGFGGFHEEVSKNLCINCEIKGDLHDQELADFLG